MMDTMLDEVKKRLLNEVKLRGYDDKYIDRNEEREILQIALQLGAGVDVARAVLVQACEDQGYVVESAVLKQVKDQIETAAGTDGRIDRQEFELIVGNAKRAVQGKKTDREVKKLVVTVMEDTGNNKVKTGWFSDWYAVLKKDLGVA